MKETEKQLLNEVYSGLLEQRIFSNGGMFMAHKTNTNIDGSFTADVYRCSTLAGIAEKFKNTEEAEEYLNRIEIKYVKREIDILKEKIKENKNKLIKLESEL